MAAEDLYIVAIELGSANVTGIAGKKAPDGTISVQAVYQEASPLFIRRGLIFNMNKTTQCVNSIKERLEERLKRKITQVYVGFGGQSIRSVFNTVSKTLGSDAPVSRDVVDELQNSNLTLDVGTNIILDVIPQNYVTGKESSIDPVGVIADGIEAQFMNIIARSSLKANIEKCFQEAGVHVAGSMLTPIVEAQTLLTDAEKRSGCVMVDFGADTTSVVVYKDNIVRYISVIPLGSSNITKDIESCQLDEQEAEHLKVTYGSAINETATIEEGREFIYTYPDGTGLTKQKFSEIVEARAKEILVNVGQQIRESGLEKGSLLSGAVFVGGGSALKNIVRAFTKYTGITQVRIVRSLPNVNFAKAANLKVTEGRYVSTLCVIEQGAQNCCGAENSEIEHQGIFKPTDEPSFEISTPDTSEKPEEPDEESKEKKPKGPSMGQKLMTNLRKFSEIIIGREDD